MTNDRPRLLVLSAAALAAFAWSGAPDAQQLDEIHGGGRARTGVEPIEPIELVPPTPAELNGDPCLQCGLIYAADCGTGLWEIDTATGMSTFIGNMPANMFDIGITIDGRLFGQSGFGDLYEISTCDASGVLRATGLSGNGSAGSLVDSDYYSQGPPLRRTETTTFGTATVGGMVGAGPPDWCGFSAGDLAMNPRDGLFYTALGCGSCPSGTRLVVVSPTTAEALAEVGCIEDAAGNPFAAIFGVAFDNECSLWGGQGIFNPALVSIDPVTAEAVEVPIVGGYDCAFGLASLPCTSCPALPRSPRSPRSPASPISGASSTGCPSFCEEATSAARRRGSTLRSRD